MANAAPITGASTRAPLTRNELSHLEDIDGDLATVVRVIRLAGNHEGSDAAYLLEAADILARRVKDRLTSLIESACADRREGR